ncbi:MAG: Uma2 family endonuclease [Lunatimonas sp.]|uniref:Uma2 family endonuclease n=1 Tax=Lunatimonas sp. TaxID=2060141 RepID=UPI00263AE60B|nr:Uma2 family endonuclease [Lunatimonas sp.]MCC5935859.1 Uma2 family endonuclease [Lunatimonas sp.]
MKMEVLKRLISVDEYHKMAEIGILKPDDRLELINGEIFEMTPIGSKHAAIVDHLAMKMNQLLSGQVIVRIQNPLRLSVTNEPEPDISILTYRSDFYASAHPVPADVLAIIEVSNASIKFDKEVKAPLYAVHGIPEYWIIDLENNRVEVFSNVKEGTYSKTKVYLPGEEISLIDKKFAVNDVFILG